MKISKQARRDAKQLFRSCLANGLLDEDRVRQVVQLVIAQKPLAYLAILLQLQRLVKLDIARRAARVESATLLTPELQSSLQNNLARIYGSGLNIVFDQNPALLGGLRIHIGSDVYDGSVQARLAGLAESF